MHILQRILKEKWERKNGETEKKFKGNTTTYIIDGVPVKEKKNTKRLLKVRLLMKKHIKY